MCLSVSSLLCVVALCILFVCLMAEKVEFCMIENEGEVDENALTPPHSNTYNYIFIFR